MLGSALVATVLKTEEITANTTNFKFEDYCGAKNCPADALPITASDPTEVSVFILLGLLIFINVLGILTTIIFMDNISYKTDDETIELDKKAEKRVDKKIGILRYYGTL